jgi:O-antigen/teichoic acid export membrane protein
MCRLTIFLRLIQIASGVVNWSCKSVAIGLTHKSKTLEARIVSGSVILLTGSGLTTAINLAYNILVARFLGPKGFGQATVVYTLLTLLSGVTLSFQIVSTKVVAQQSTLEGKAAAYRGFHRSAWACGLAVALVLLFFQQPIANYLNLPDSTLVAILAIGAAFYVPLGSRRGYIQGTYGFRRLAINLVLEGAVRLGGSFFLILSGFGVRGVIEANAAAVAVAYFAIAPKLAARIPNPLSLSYALRETTQALIFFSGQVLINNCDIVLVKHFFASREAGLYAAVAMVGRVIFAFSSAVVNSTFPLVAGTRHEERKDLRVIATSLLLVFGSGSVLALGLCITPASIWSSLFGSEFAMTGGYSLPHLLALYAFSTVVYSLSVVIITFEMSFKISITSWVQLIFSGVVIGGICLFHSSLHQVIIVQLVLMAVLFVFVAIPFLIDSLTDPKGASQPGQYGPVKVIRRVAEDEVIAEFLKGDFDHSAYRDYRKTLRDVVLKPNLANGGENTIRRALLFVRHFALWKELPADTRWFEVEISESDLDQVRIFPRAQWRKLARGNFSITQIIEGMRTQPHLLDGPFLSKIASIGDRIRQSNSAFGAVVLIGLSEDGPLTVLDGNHRLVSAMLSTPSGLKRLRFMCGLSPRMTECCWYNTNLVTLFRYARNVMTQTVHNPEADLRSLLQSAAWARPPMDAAS